jgi:HD superfamily phosphohydrolase
MRWHDRVYGEVAIEDPGILDLIGCPSFQRLKGVRQAGPSALAFPFKNVTRFEHSLGAFILLRRLGADRREQVAGLLHDISHTAFSHAVDFVFSSEEQDHHEQLKPLMLDRPDIAAALVHLGYAPREFYDDSIYPLLEQPLPWLCADRLDYFLRDGLACGVVSPAAAGNILGHLTVLDRRIVFTDTAVARQAAELFAAMNRDWWAGPTEAYIYNEFAEALHEAMRLGVLHLDDLLTEDDHVLAQLEASGSPLIAAKLEAIRHFRPESLIGYQPRIIPKERWLDPPVQTDQTFERLSVLEGRVLPARQPRSIGDEPEK